MPSQTSSVGGLTIPVPAEPVGTKFADPAVEYILDFASFFIKDALDARLATIRPAGLTVDAVPVQNRFTFDPMEPQGVNKKLPLPCLFVYWTGKSERIIHSSLLQYRKRTLGLMYAYEELPSFASLDERRGWSNAVDAALHKMSERQLHPDYTPPGGSPGMSLYQALAPLGVICWKYLGGQSGRFGIDQGPNAARAAKKRSGRDWPAVMGMFEVTERIQQETMVDPDDVTTDIAMGIYGGSESDQTQKIMDRFLPAPDGTEEL